MEVIIKQIERGLERGFHYLAIVTALTLPDICAALESANGETTNTRYKAWYDAWLAPRYPMISAFDMYRLRSGIIHQGILGPSGMQYNRIVFMIGRPKMHCCISSNSGGLQETVLQLDAAKFCKDMMDAVKSWYAAKNNDANVQANLPRLLQFRPHGLPPHFVGMPLIG